MELIAFGMSFLELVFGHIDHLPDPGEEVWSQEFALSCGGAVSIASAARAAGITSAIATDLGDDLGSRIVVEHCRAAGVDLAPSRRVAGRTAGISVVMNFDGDRAFVSHLPRPRDSQGDSARWQAVLREHRPPWAYLHAGRDVLSFLETARDVGTRVALDVSMGEIEAFPDEVLACLPHGSVFVPNEAEFCRLASASTFEAALEVAPSWGVPVVAKRGPLGAVVIADGTVTAVPEGVRDVVVRDRTGAGDAFAGALVASLAQGSSLVAATRMGNTAGSAAVARLGAVGEVELDGFSVAAPIGATADDREEIGQ